MYHAVRPLPGRPAKPADPEVSTKSTLDRVRPPRPRVRISRVLSPPHDVDKDGSADREASSLESASCRASYRATPRAAFRAATLRRTTGATSVPSSSIARSTRSCGIGPTVS